MPYISREDGERFVIPSYRDVLSAKKTALLKREVMTLSAKYGEFITLQKKTSDQYEIAFSPDTGYLLGETVWHYFKRPQDLIYCEAIPNTAEAILVIVKSGSVYLDGSFPIDSISEELLIFRTQQNNFDIYIYGDVPISQTPEAGKFSLQPTSIKSFHILPSSAFAVLPRLKAFQLRLVDQVLRAQGIGIFPVKKLIIALVIFGLVWMAYTYITTHRKELPTILVQAVNPYQPYFDELNKPDPSYELLNLIKKINLLTTAPGWQPESIVYTSPKLKAKMLSSGVRTNVLFFWASKNYVTIDLDKDGFYASTTLNLYNRQPTYTIMPMKMLLASLIDKMSYILSGNSIKLDTIVDRGKFKEASVTISFNSITLPTLEIIAQQFKQLPMVLLAVNIQLTPDGLVSGTLTLKVLGS